MRKAELLTVYRMKTTHGNTQHQQRTIQQCTRPEDILRVMERGEIYSTGTLADKTSIARRTALKYLNELAEQGRIEKEMPNANTAVWIRRE